MSFRIAVDLDSVLLKYKTSDMFKRVDNIMPYSKYGVLLPGAKEALTELRKEGHEIVILSRRSDRVCLLMHLRSKLKLPFDALVSPAKDIAYDVHISSGGITFTGDWGKAFRDIQRFLKRGTWEERKLGKKVKKGLAEQTKGIL